MRNDDEVIDGLFFDEEKFVESSARVLDELFAACQEVPDDVSSDHETNAVSGH